MTDVQGRCPACRGASLFLGEGGHVTCSRLDCPNPTAADELLHSTNHAWVTEARIRDVIADMENITGARHWARILRKVVDGEEPALGTAETQATDGEPSGFAAPAGLYDKLMDTFGGTLPWPALEPRLTVLPIDPQAERAATERARQAAADSERATETPQLVVPRDMTTTLHRTLGHLLGDQDAQAIARIRELHTEDYGSCRECTHSHSVPWPCPTIRALDQPKGQPRV